MALSIQSQDNKEELELGQFALANLGHSLNSTTSFVSLNQECQEFLNEHIQYIDHFQKELFVQEMQQELPMQQVYRVLPGK